MSRNYFKFLLIVVLGGAKSDSCGTTVSQGPYGYLYLVSQIMYSVLIVIFSGAVSDSCGTTVSPGPDV